MDSTSQEHRTDANVIRVNPMKEGRKFYSFICFYFFSLFFYLSNYLAYEKKISLLERQLAASLNAQKKLEENCRMFNKISHDEIFNFIDSCSSS